MKWILHIIHELSGGGAARETINIARHLNAAVGYRHKIISLKPSDKQGLSLAQSAGIEVIENPTRDVLFSEIEQADIVQIEWWNCSLVSQLYHVPFPDCRLVTRYHVAGDKAPHIITPNHLKFSDMNILSKSENAVLMNLDTEWKERRVAYILHGADFSRMPAIQQRPHIGFNVGYIGTVNFVKMHPDYVEMSNRIAIPDVRFKVCGTVGEPALLEEVKRLRAEHKFEFLGYVDPLDDIIAEMDVFGYPLCPDTYASTELVLQEVMYAGIPPVVFPHGGVTQTVHHNKNGYVVQNADEYVKAIEYLYKTPHERKRLGASAKEYVITHLGVENTARKYNEVYQALMNMKKKTHKWGLDSHTDAVVVQENAGQLSPAEVFIESLGEDVGQVFEVSMRGTSLDEVIRAEVSIKKSRYVLAKNGIIRFRNLYPEDPYLNVWAGLCCEELSDLNAAAVCFSTAVTQGLTQWRVYWYLARILKKMGDKVNAANLMNQIKTAVPEFDRIRDFYQKVQSASEQEIATEAWY